MPQQVLHRFFLPWDTRVLYVHSVCFTACKKCSDSTNKKFDLITLYLIVSTCYRSLKDQIRKSPIRFSTHHRHSVMNQLYTLSACVLARTEERQSMRTVSCVCTKRKFTFQKKKKFRQRTLPFLQLCMCDQFQFRFRNRPSLCLYRNRQERKR